MFLYPCATASTKALEHCSKVNSKSMNGNVTFLQAIIIIYLSCGKEGECEVAIGR